MDLAALGEQLGLVILRVFSNINDSIRENQFCGSELDLLRLMQWYQLCREIRTSPEIVK